MSSIDARLGFLSAAGGFLMLSLFTATGGCGTGSSPTGTASEFVGGQQGCPELSCAYDCRNGYATDRNGCMTCDCVSDEAGPPAKTCKANADCDPGTRCGFWVDDACAAVGRCVPIQTDICDVTPKPACGCDGAPVYTICNDLQDGYAASPVRHLGACADGGAIVDGG